MSVPAPSMTFDLVGLPGSGKTSLYREAVPRLVAAGVPLAALAASDAAGAEDKVRRDAPDLWRRSRRYLDAAARARPADDPEERERWSAQQRALWFGRVFDAERSTSAAGPVFMEESTTHELWRIAFFLREHGRPVTARRAERALGRGLAGCRTTFHVDVTPATAIRRIAGKVSRGPINRMLAAAGEDSTTWSGGHRSYRRLVARRRADADVVRLDNERDDAFERNVTAIVTTVLAATGREPELRVPTS